MTTITRSFAKLTLALVAAGLFASCQDKGISGSGNITSQNRNVTEDFTGIEASRGVEVIVEQSDVKSIIVEADDNVQAHILVTVEKGVLKVTSDQSNFSNVTKKVTVTMPVIKSLTTESGAMISSKNVIKSAETTITAESGSTIDLNLEVDKIICESESGSTIQLKGKALSMETSSSSGSTIDAEDLIANEVSAQSSTGSSTSVQAVVKLNAKASTGSSIENRGTPKTLDKEENSGGSVSVQ